MRRRRKGRLEARSPRSFRIHSETFGAPVRLLTNHKERTVKNHAAFIIAVAASTLAAGCSFTSNTRSVEPVPVATQRTVYPDGTYSDRTVVPATTTTVSTIR